MNATELTRLIEAADLIDENTEVVEIGPDHAAEDEEAGDEEYTFDLVKNGARKVVTVDATSYEEAEESIEFIRDRDFPGHTIEDHAG